MRRTRHILKKEFVQFVRDRRMRFMVVFAPIFQLLLFAYVVNTDVEHVTVAICDLDRSPTSRAVVRSFTASELFDVVLFTQRPRDLTKAIDSGAARLAVRIDPGFDRGIRRGESPPIQLLLDGTESQIAQVAAGYAMAVVNRTAGGRPESASSGFARPASRPTLEIVPRVWFNPTLDSRIYNIPGVLVLVIQLTTMILSSMAIVKEREIGTIEQLIVTPIKPVELMLGKTLPFALIGTTVALAVSNVAVWVFGVPMRGSVLVLILGVFAFLLSTLGLGLFISTVARTQQQAMMTAIFIMLPAVLLSGFAFPIASMPGWAQAIASVNPLKYFLAIARGVFLRGSGLSDLAREFVSLSAFGIVILGLSVLRFRKRLA